LNFAADQYRFDGLRDLLHHTDAQQFMTGAYRYDVNSPPENKGLHEALRDSLRERAKAFVEAPTVISPAKDLAYKLGASEFIKGELSKALRQRLREVKLLRGEAPPLGSADLEERTTADARQTPGVRAA
jgi:hypothetical protein